MSKQNKPIPKVTIPKLIAQKGKSKIVALTAYTAPFAEILDQHVDILLVGDSLGMVIYGMESTVPVTIEMMIAHGKAVAKTAKHACVIVDMPFGSYQTSKEQAFDNCAKVMKETGCVGVKLEGGAEMAETISYLTKRGIPVMSHIGLMPQRVNSYGGYPYQGRTKDEQDVIMGDAKSLNEAGAFIILMECIDKTLAAKITKQVSVPTIGIGAGAGCDGQIVVTEDMAGLFTRTAKFVKKHGDLKNLLDSAASNFANEVRDGTYPTDEHSFGE